MPKEDSTETRPRRGDRGLFGVVLLFAGLAWFLSRAGMLHLAADTVLSILLIGIGAGLLITRRSGRRFWPILLGGIVLFVLMGSSASARVHWGGPTGDPIYTPLTVDQLRPYQLGAGDMQLDLTHLAFSGTVHVEAQMLAGQLVVTVPRGVGVQIDYKDTVGDVTVEGRHVASGLDGSGTWTSPGYDTAGRKLNLSLEMQAGRILVRSDSSHSSIDANPPAPPVPKSPSQPPSSRQPK